MGTLVVCDVEPVVDVDGVLDAVGASVGVVLVIDGVEGAGVVVAIEEDTRMVLDSVLLVVDGPSIVVDVADVDTDEVV